MTDQHPTKKEVVSLLLANFGCTIEWFEFSIFAFLAPTLSELFFSHLSHWLGLVITFAIFAVAYLCRPFGSLLFGYIGDKHGRVKSLVISSFMMSVSTILLGCIPTPATLGETAVVLLVVMRLLQGLSLGGEYSGAMIYGGESRWQQRKSLLSALPNTAANIGIFLCTISLSFLTGMFSKAQLLAWGWRIPFIVIGVLGIILFLFRVNLGETHLYKKVTNKVTNPIKATFQRHKTQLIIMLFCIWVNAVFFYMVGIYMPTFLATAGKLTTHQALNLNTLSIVMMIFLVPCFSLISDRFGRRKMMLIFALSILCLSYLCFSLLISGQWLYIIAGLIVLTLISCISQSTLPAIFVSLFPTETRFTGLSFSYNLSYGIFGGTTPLVATLALKTTTHWYFIPLYMMLTAALSLPILYFVLPKYGIEK